MDSFEFNKLIGALLATVFVVLSVAIVSDSIFGAHAPEKPGYVIEAAEASEPGAGAAEPAAPVLIAPLLAAANVEAGATVFKKCAACHTTEKGGANKIGPNLWDIVNRPAATHEGFAYSAAMKDHGKGGTVLWDYESLSQFITAPKAYIKGTAMGFVGDKKVEDRANLIAYLRTLSDNPAPLPQ